MTNRFQSAAGNPAFRQAVETLRREINEAFEKAELSQPEVLTLWACWLGELAAIHGGRQHAEETCVDLAVALTDSCKRELDRWDHGDYAGKYVSIN